MARASSGLAYPKRFYTTMAYAGFGDGSNGSDNRPAKIARTMLASPCSTGLYQQSKGSPVEFFLLDLGFGSEGADLRCSGLSQEDILRGIPSVP
ncbi:uncharacterized protein A4U43_C06F16860 [Asparagus officinalis]|uniref:Uncharacterized protein n=1 Tax=Asparagus officinalis TaxID=4686 RepID=A0A5P1EMM4_ASPOF|nr:uncharacterized protein A4U43_C06F16860 [Asparagus officinalis]